MFDHNIYLNLLLISRQKEEAHIHSDGGFGYANTIRANGMDRIFIVLTHCASDIKYKYNKCTRNETHTHTQQQYKAVDLDKNRRRNNRIVVIFFSVCVCVFWSFVCISIHLCRLHFLDELTHGHFGIYVCTEKGIDVT